MLVSKFSLFQTFVYSSLLSVVAVTETWLSEITFNKEILPNGYSVFRKDCASCGSGVLVAVACRLSTILSLELFLHSHIIIYVVYVPPASCENYWLSLLDYFYGLFSSGIPTFVVGDFNHPLATALCFFQGSSLLCDLVCFLLAFQPLLLVILIIQISTGQCFLLLPRSPLFSVT